MVRLFIVCIVVTLAFLAAPTTPAIVPPTPTLDQLHHSTPIPRPPTPTADMPTGAQKAAHTVYLPLAYRSGIR